MKKKLHSWQKECLEKWFANHGRGMIQAVTGSGKTYLALTAADQLERKLNQELRVKIVVPTAGLMLQWDRALREFLADSSGKRKNSESMRGIIGLRGGGFRDAVDCKYMIYVINSARYELARQILAELREGKAVLLIADECHHYQSGQNQLIFEFLPYIKEHEPHFFSMGLSATLPSGQGRRYLASVLGRRIYHYGMAEASAGHTVCPYDIYHIQLSFQTDEQEQYQELTDRMQILYRKLIQECPFLKRMDQIERFELLRQLSGDKDQKIAEAAQKYMQLTYKRKSLVCLASDRIVCVCDLAERLDQKEKILIFGERISQAEELYQILQRYFPGKVGRYHSQMGRQANKMTLERFREGEIRILVTCKAVDEGVDVPDATAGIILSGTSAQRQRIQRLGRIVRTKEGKERASLYYLHIAETSEDSCFLPNTGKDRVFELKYSSDTREFSNDIYDNAAREIWDQMQNAGADERKMREIRRCLRLGCVRSDWMLEKETIQKQIDIAKYASDRNYWICMKKIKDSRAVVCVKKEENNHVYSCNMR